MSGSMISGLTGMRANQRLLDVIGHNLANANTAGFKRSRVLFGDLISQLLRPGSAGNTATGGVNPLQVGTGTGVSSIDRIYDQGGLLQTGRVFDLALSGQGFFALEGGSNTFFTRVGAFDVDASGNLVDARTGYRVLSDAGGAITLDLDSVDPPNATSALTFGRNLPAEITGPLAETLTTEEGLAEGQVAILTGTNPGPVTFTTAATITITVGEGSAQPVTFPAGTLDLQTLADRVNQSVTGAQASVQGNALVLETTAKGQAATIQVQDVTAGTAAQLGFSTSLVHGSETAATRATDLSQLTTNRAAYSVGDRIRIAGVDAEGSPVGGTFAYGVDGTTLGELMDHVGAQFAGATLSLDGAGNLVLTADEGGEADLALVLSDDPQNATGATTWSRHGFELTQDGTGPDEVVTSMQVYDPSGTDHTVTFRFVRRSADVWDLHAELPDGTDGSVLDGTITGLTFGADGTLQPVTGPHAFTFQWGSEGDTQTIAADFGTFGSLDGLTQLGDTSTARVVEQDGYGVGTLSNVQVLADGMIEGYYDNGQSRELGWVGVATFANVEGLEAQGDTLFVRSAASGAAELGRAANGRASIVGGSLEASNVETAEEFVRLIEAQRAFQANARVISASDELLAEVVNLI